jgi:four helix bundle protein
MKIERFEDIEAWQKARELAGEVYKVSSVGSLNKDFGLRDQIRRAAVSVMANIAEGFGRRTNKDFANYLYTAKGSSMEMISHMYVVLDQKHIEKEKFESIKLGYEQVIKMLINFIRYLESNPGSR